MQLTRPTIILLILFSLISGTIAATAIQERKVKQVTRVKRPTFVQSDWDGVYFENLFAEGLVGARPAATTGGSQQTASNLPANPSSNLTTETNEFAWSKLIGRSTLEDEVKSQQKNLAVDITTPVKFKSDYAKVNQSFSVLSMIFAVIRQYDGEVRWQESAGEIQASFERAAANSRVGTIQAFESCKRRAEGLQELVRGGKFVSEEKSPDDLDWSLVVDRSPLMGRLEQAEKKLKTLTANGNEFTRAAAEVLHESEIVTAIAAVLIQENMTDADDEGYRAFATEMQQAASSVSAAVKVQDYAAAEKGVNSISQSCNHCHDEWR